MSARSPFVVWLMATALCLAATSVAQAQSAPPLDDPTDSAVLRDWSDEVPAHVSFAEGEVWLDREGTIDGAPKGVPLLAGDRLNTRQGRIEILFADGSVLSLDQETRGELLSDDLLRLDTGRIRLDLTRAAGSAGYRVEAAGTTIWILAAGEYRVEVDPRNTATPDVRLLVVRGQAELSANGRRTLVRAGYEAFGSARTTPSLPHAVTVSGWDSFDRWWDDRRASRSGFASAQYLPSEIAYYSGVLDREGDWRYEPTHGYVWYPRVVDTWHPYSTGRWSFVGTYGWVWVGADRWAWPTHHYGRWGYSGQRYYWIPGRHWAPAWVAWASSPTYIGWVPLGYDHRPLISVHIGYSSGWRGWTHVPARSFSAGIVVANRTRYVPPRSLQFSDRYRGPGRPSTIVVRQTPGLRGPAGATARGSVAVPRTAAGQPNLATTGTPGRMPAPAGGQYRGAPDRATPGVATAPGRQPAPAPTTRTNSIPARVAPTRSPAPDSGAPPARTTPSSRTVAPTRAPQRIDPSAGAPGAIGSARPRISGSAPAPTTPSRASRPSAAPASEGPMRAPVFRSRPPAASTEPATSPAPRNAPDRARPMAAPGVRSAPGREAPVVRPVPAARPAQVDRSAPATRQAPATREAPASRPAPSARQAPADRSGGRAVPRARE